VNFLCCKGIFFQDDFPGLVKKGNLSKHWKLNTVNHKFIQSESKEILLNNAIKG